MRWRVAESKILKKFAKFGFLFFLVKGLLWLIIPGLVALLYSIE